MPDGRGSEFEDMSDEELIAAMTPAISSSIHACYYRVLGLANVPWNISPIERFMELNAQGAGIFLGEIEPVYVDERLHIWLWKNCDISEGHGITFNLYVGGLADSANTYFTRKYWWKLYLLRGMMEKSLEIEPEVFRVREYLG